MSETCPMCREYRLYHGDTCPEHQPLAPPATNGEAPKSSAEATRVCRHARPPCKQCRESDRMMLVPADVWLRVAEAVRARRDSRRDSDDYKRGYDSGYHARARTPPTPPDAALIAEIDRWLVRGFHVTDVEVAGTLRKLRDRLARQTPEQEKDRG